MNPRFIEIKKQIGKFIANFSVTEENGKEYIFDGDVIREGLEISTYDDNGDVIPLPDGDYTVKGVAIVVADGKVTELPRKNSTEVAEADPKAKQEPTPDTAVPESTDTAEKDGRISELEAENERLKAEIETLKAELNELKNVPMADPVPQRTDMSADTEDDVPESVKGTKFERAYKIFKA